MSCKTLALVCSVIKLVIFYPKNLSNMVLLWVALPDTLSESFDQDISSNEHIKHTCRTNFFICTLLKLETPYLRGILKN